MERSREKLINHQKELSDDIDVALKYLTDLKLHSEVLLKKVGNDLAQNKNINNCMWKYMKVVGDLNEELETLNSENGVAYSPPGVGEKINNNDEFKLETTSGSLSESTTSLATSLSSLSNLANGLSAKGATPIKAQTVSQTSQAVGVPLASSGSIVNQTPYAMSPKQPCGDLNTLKNSFWHPIPPPPPLPPSSGELNILANPIWYPTPPSTIHPQGAAFMQSYPPQSCPPQSYPPPFRPMLVPGPVCRPVFHPQLPPPPYNYLEHTSSAPPLRNGFSPLPPQNLQNVNMSPMGAPLLYSKNPHTPPSETVKKQTEESSAPTWNLVETELSTNSLLTDSKTSKTSLISPLPENELATQLDANVVCPLVERDECANNKVPVKSTIELKATSPAFVSKLVTKDEGATQIPVNVATELKPSTRGRSTQISAEFAIEDQTADPKSVFSTFPVKQHIEMDALDIDRSPQTVYPVMLETVVSPSEFYVQVTTTKYLELFSNMTNDIKKYFKDNQKHMVQSYHITLVQNTNKRIIAKQQLGEYAMCMEDGVWSRVHIHDWLDQRDFDDMVHVSFIDSGEIREVSLKDLQPMNPDFTKYPVFALRCRLGGIQPNKGKNWSDSAIDLFRQILIVDELFNIEVCEEDCEEHDATSLPVKVFIGSNKFTVNEKLVNLGCATQTTTSSLDLREPFPCYPNLRTIVDPKGLSYQYETPPPLDEDVDILVTTVIKVNRVCCIRSSVEKTVLRTIQDAIDETELSSLDAPPEEGQLVVAEYFEDNCLYRAKVLESDPHLDIYHIVYLDFGNHDRVSLDKLKEMTQELMEVPCQMMECFMAVKPNAEVSMQKVMDFLKKKMTSINKMRPRVQLPGEGVRFRGVLYDTDGCDVALDLRRRNYANIAEEE